MANTKEKPQSAQEKTTEQREIREHNLRFYEQGCEVPQDALKEIKAGRLKGMSDVNPMWRMKRMTEIFGPCGIGWKYTIDRQWVEPYGNEVKCFCNVSLYVRDPETKEWSDAIPGNGGSAIVSSERNGPYVNDEGYKMALTDALSIAMKPLGIGANIWYGPKAKGHNESKYESYTTEQQEKQSVPPQNDAAILAQALSELDAVKSQKEFEQVWQKWATSAHRSICHNGTVFYNKACEKMQSLKQPAK